MSNMYLQITVNFADGTDRMIECSVGSLAGLGGMVPTALEKEGITEYSSLQIIVVPDPVDDLTSAGERLEAAIAAGDNDAIMHAGDDIAHAVREREQSQATVVTEDLVSDMLGSFADQLDAALQPQKLPGLDLKLHIDGMSGTMRQVRDGLAEIVRAQTGEDPWETNPFTG